MSNVMRKRVRLALEAGLRSFVASVSLSAVSASAQSTCPSLVLTVVEAVSSPETRTVKIGDQTLLVRRSAITTTSDIAELKVEGPDIETHILIKYKPDAAARLLEATTDRDGLNLALVIEDDVLLAFTWRGPFGIGPEGTQVTLRDGKARALALQDAMQGCIGPQTR